MAGFRLRLRGAAAPLDMPDFIITSDADLTALLTGSLATASAVLNGKLARVSKGVTLSANRSWSGLNCPDTFHLEAEPGGVVGADMPKITGTHTLSSMTGLKITGFEIVTPAGGRSFSGNIGVVDLLDISNNHARGPAFNITVGANYDDVPPVCAKYFMSSSGGGFRFRRLRIADNKFEYYEQVFGLALDEVGGDHLIQGNAFGPTYTDPVQLSPRVGYTDVPRVTYAFNTHMEIVGRGTDYPDKITTNNGSGGPHPDGMQRVGPVRLNAYSNIFIPGPNGRGHFGGLFNESLETMVAGSVNAFNIIVRRYGGTYALQDTHTETSFYWKQFIVRETPGTGGTGIANMAVGSAASYDVVLGANYSEDQTFVKTLPVTGAPNIDLADSAADYNAKFPAAGGVWGMTAFQGWIDAFAPLMPEVDWATRTVDWAAVPSGVAFEPKLNQPVSTAVTTQFSRVKNAPNGAAPFEIFAGQTLIKANSYAGAGAVEIPGPATGTLTTTDWVALKVTTPAGSSTEALFEPTINGFPVQLRVVTASAPWQTTLWSGAYAASPSGGLTDLPASQKATLILRFNQLAEMSTGRILRMAAGSTFELKSNSYLDVFSLLVRDTTGTIVAGGEFSPGTDWVAANLTHTLAISIDLTNPVAGERIKWFWDGAAVTATSPTAVNNGNSMWFNRPAEWTFMSGDDTTRLNAKFDFLLLKPGVAMTREEISALDSATITPYVGSGNALLLFGDAAEANGGTFEKGGVGAFTMKAGTITDVV